MTSRIQTVVALVKERGQASADDLVPLMPHCTRKQIIRALQNAKADGWLDSLGHVPRRGKGCGQGSQVTTYTPTDKRKEVNLLRYQIPSVFFLAQKGRLSLHA